MNTKNKLLLSLFLLFAGLIFTACSPKTGSRQRIPNVEVQAVRVVKGDINHFIKATGRVEAYKKVDIIAPVEGIITKLFVREGSFVKKGSVVALLRPIEAEAAIRGSKAFSLPIKRSFLMLGIISLTAPFSGYVSKRYVSSSALVRANTPIVTVEDTRSTYLHVDLPSIYLEQIKIGNRVLIYFLSFPGDAFKGRIATINPTVSQQTQTVALNVNFPNKDQEIKDGMFAVVDIISSTHKNTLLVPKNAILFNPDTGRKYIMVVSRGSIARSITVKTGYEEDDRVEVTKGLTQGELVITQGNYALADGTRVKVVTQLPTIKSLKIVQPQGEDED